MSTAKDINTTNDAISAFSFEGANVRIFNRKDEPMWVLSDVCNVLGILNVGNVRSRLDEDEVDDIRIVDAIGRNQETTIINESGLYSLILTSRKPAAKRFKKWVTAEVLPAIRKTGVYSVATARPKRKPAFDTTYLRLLRIARACTHLDATQQRFHATEGTYELTGVNPLKIMDIKHIPSPDSETYLTPTDIGKKLDLSGRRINQLLIEQGYQIATGATGSSLKYEATEKGSPLSRVFDSAREHGPGTQQQLKWSSRIAEELRPFSQVVESVS